MAKKLIQILISFFVFGFCLLLATLADSENISDSFSLKHLIIYIFVIQWIVFIPCYILKTEKIYDLTGKVILNDDTNSLQLEHISNGMYFLEITVGLQTEVFKLIKK